MTKKTQAQTPEEIAHAFMQLWQEKWNETLRQKGWPEDAPIPGLGQMPFFNPFMPMTGFSTPGAPDVNALALRIAQLEQRIKILEAKKTSPKATTKKFAKPAKTMKKKASKKAKKG